MSRESEVSPTVVNQPQNRTTSGPKRGPDGRFLAGHSGNPGGRALSLSGEIRRRFGDDGTRLVGALTQLAFGKRVPYRCRIAALRELLDRGYGRPAALKENPTDEVGIFTQFLIDSYASWEREELEKADVGKGPVDNTSPIGSPVSVDAAKQ